MKISTASQRRIRTARTEGAVRMKISIARPNRIRTAHRSLARATGRTPPPAVPGEWRRLSCPPEGGERVVGACPAGRPTGSRARFRQQEIAHALHAGFRSLSYAPARRTRKLRLPCRQARGRRELLPREHRAPPRQLAQVGTQAPAPDVQSRAVQGLRRRHSDAGPPPLCCVQGQGPGGQPRPQAAVAG